MALLGFPCTVWTLLAVEFAERLGYYAVSFSLFTYCTNMLRLGPVATNALLNGLYLVIPLAACVASGVADGRVGRPRTLRAALATYTAGLTLLTLSSSPPLYDDFPRAPTRLGLVLFACALVTFSVGYGAMKVCTNPMMADGVVAYMRAQHDGAYSHNNDNNDNNNEHNDSSNDNKDMVDDDDDHVARDKRGATVPPTPDAATAHAHDDDNDDAACVAALSRLFRCIYWVSNAGALVGIAVAPLLRGLDARKVTLGDASYTAGYYVSFAMATCSVAAGLVAVLYTYAQFVRNPPAPAFVLVRLVARAVYARWCPRTSHANNSLNDHDSCVATDVVCVAADGVDGDGAADTAARDKHTNDDDDVTAARRTRPHAPREDDDDAARVLPSSPSPSPPPLLSLRPSAAPCRYDVDDVNARGWVDDCYAALRLCRAFVALPVYWLVCNQFSSNLMYVAAAVDLPDGAPQEVFNNVNTLALLGFLLVFDRILDRRRRQGVQQDGDDVSNASPPPPAARTRIAAGFALMCVSMLWCAAVQATIVRRGRYVHDDDADDGDVYVLYDATSRRVSWAWLLVPYTLQGIAAALVDTTVMEVAYVAAPTHLKGTVMALYWLASSASGLLGVVFAPVMRPQNALLLFVGFALVLALVTVLFVQLNDADCRRSRRGQRVRAA